MKSIKIKVYLISVFVVILWGLSYIWSNSLIMQGIPAEYFVFVRVFAGSIMLLILNLVTGTSLRIHKKDLPKFLLLAAFEPFIYFICESYGLILTESPTYSAMIVATTPLFSIIAGRLFFKEKLTHANILGFFICVEGIVIVSIAPGGVGKYFVFGALLLVLTAICEVGQASVTKWLSPYYKPQVITMYQFLIGSAFLLPLFLFKGLENYDPAVYMSWSVWKPILCLALLCSVVCFTLWVYSIQHLGVAKACILLAMVPVITALASTIIGTDHLKLYQWVGIILACAGVVLSQLNPGKILSTSHDKQ